MQHIVLVADDDEEIRDLLVVVLEEAGYNVIEAGNGQRAVELAVEHRPDVALLDVMMPVMDGFDACRAIKTDPRTADIPVLLLTALAHTSSKVQGLDEGATDYITKPFANAELLARLRAILQEKSRRDTLVAEALTDALTGLTNRRGLERQLDQLMAHASRIEEPLSVLMFDADRFKSVNDTFGHETGDVVLTALAQRAQESIRAQDVVGRFGGEEFLVILPGAGRSAAVTAAERLRAHVADHPIVTPAGPIAVTVSVGAATMYPNMDIEHLELVTTADNALYSAKRGGRNRVAHADGQSSDPLAMPEPPEAARALVAALALVDAAEAERAHEVARLCWTISSALRLAPAERAHIGVAGLLHNIDAIVAPQPALAAAGSFTPPDPPDHPDHPSGEDRRIYVDIVGDLLRRLPSLQSIVELVGARDEWWDGSGGPRGLRGEAIPLGSRVIAVAAVYDRARRAAAGDPVAALRAAAGSRLDPLVVVAALRSLR